jgi:hypothetical protein
MYCAKLHNTVDEPWTAMEAIRAGRVPTGAGTPGVYVTVGRGRVPFARIDAWPLTAGPFTQIETCKRFVVLGWSDPAIASGRKIAPIAHTLLGK